MREFYLGLCVDWGPYAVGAASAAGLIFGVGLGLLRRVLGASSNTVDGG